ncbi:ComEC/Rec2 family competence protein [Kurthia sibirica]|uniref:MBL fold metallo-hydrolase n=1 Tax=Kurthia sibirica TaxID=202750 RepID=A0A2U3AHU1_9BACL|nr:ComEC/Rec2 family competence protein [Kurthia sibirica]PWI24126.1 MBL fold metallo-hydrolase [Kurthia sibirica]GEK35297.1 metallo beta-lactamase superfamily lipoprotein [Kurthia sibirica]
MKKIATYIIISLAMLALASFGLLGGDNEALKNIPTEASSGATNKVTTTKLDELKLHIINIGQGDALLIQSASENFLIDAGNKGQGDEVLAYLHEQNITKLDAVVSTHPDADHIGGLAEVIREMDVTQVYAPRITHTTDAYKQFLLAVKEHSLKIKIAKNGVAIPTSTTGLSLDFISPTKDYSKSDLNDWSAVLLVTHGAKKFLLTGDAEIPAEKDMMTAHNLQPVDVLKVSHHGAAEATTMAFLGVIQPKLAAISVGEDNRYKHPTKDVLQRLDKIGAKTYRTDQHGSIVFISNGKNIITKVER